MSKEELIIGFFEKGYCCDLDEVKDTCLDLLKENAELRKQLNELQKPQIFIDTQDMEEQYGEQLYQDYLEKQQEEFISYLEKEIVNCKAGSGQQYYAQEHLKMFKEIIGVKNA